MTAYSVQEIHEDMEFVAWGVYRDDDLVAQFASKQEADASAVELWAKDLLPDLDQGPN